MNILRNPALRRAAFAGLLALLVAGCTAMLNPSALVPYTPKPATAPIAARVTLEVHHTLAPSVHGNWRDETVMGTYCRAVETALRNDLTTSGLFARGIADDPALADYQVKLESSEYRQSGYRLRAVLTATEASTGRHVTSRVREISLGNSSWAYSSVKINELLPDFMAALKDELARDLLDRARSEQAAVSAIDTLQNASLSDLLAASDATVEQARTRNRALIAAKTRQLPDILRNWKTADLTTLVVKVEQTILDLNHECEVAKDKAQQMTADGVRESASSGRPRAQVAAGKLDELRELSIAYRERIELLKPILSAIKEEIVNRGR